MILKSAGIESMFGIASTGRKSAKDSRKKVRKLIKYKLSFITVIWDKSIRMNLRLFDYLMCFCRRKRKRAETINLKANLLLQE